MREPRLEIDHWELESGEERSAAYPDTFEIPPLEHRTQLRRGLAAKLMFVIETKDETGTVDVGVERMWVYVTENLGDGYLGVLDNDPASYEASDDIYLVLGAEVPFGPEHVIQIAQPPDDYPEPEHVASPTRRWPRD